MFYWIYDVPTLWVIVLFEATFVGVCWLGTLFLRPAARSWLGQEPRLNDMLAAFLQYFGVIYGLLLGLLAVATYQNRLDVAKSNANEASSLSALYRNITAYPEPSRTELQNLLKEHTRYLIEDAWPKQRKGIVPVDEVRIGLSRSKRSLRFSSHRPKRKNSCTRTPCGNSTPSTRIEGRGFIASPPASLPSFGTPWLSGRLST